MDSSTYKQYMLYTHKKSSIQHGGYIIEDIIKKM